MCTLLSRREAALLTMQEDCEACGCGSGGGRAHMLNCWPCLGWLLMGLAIVAQYLEELMSTRLGVQRQGEVLSADRRTGPDGREYYDIQARARACFGVPVCFAPQGQAGQSFIGSPCAISTLFERPLEPLLGAPGAEWCQMCQQSHLRMLGVLTG